MKSETIKYALKILKIYTFKIGYRFLLKNLVPFFQFRFDFSPNRPITNFFIHSFIYIGLKSSCCSGSGSLIKFCLIMNFLSNPVQVRWYSITKWLFWKCSMLFLNLLQLVTTCYLLTCYRSDDIQIPTNSRADEHG